MDDKPISHSQILPFRKWLGENHISVTVGYELVKKGALTLVRIGRRSYVTRQEADRFINSLQNGGSHAA